MFLRLLFYDQRKEAILFSFSLRFTFITMFLASLNDAAYDSNCRIGRGQMQSQKMQSALRKLLPYGAKPSRSHPSRRKQSHHSRNTLQRLRHMRQKMPLQSHQHRQLARRVGEGLQSPFQRKQLQTFPFTHAFAWHGFGVAGSKRHRQKHNA